MRQGLCGPTPHYEILNITAEGSAKALHELYRSDAYTWAMQQAEALRRRGFAAIDWDNVIEEVECVGRNERSSWMNHCARAIEHLIMLEHWLEPELLVGSSWKRSVRRARLEMRSTLDDNPGLKARQAEPLRTAWKKGRRFAIEELTDYEMAVDPLANHKTARREWERTIPTERPYSLEQIEAPDWWPKPTWSQA